ncbi:MAG TPA: hypothetical protein O0Y06_04360 [Methanocorpusculum sp.]|nr:hypothetical protein [Methanocorpusculum sp.]HJK80115.1 hypothetical protein [Methanocorpusculum sp.]
MNLDNKSQEEIKMCDYEQKYMNKLVKKSIFSKTTTLSFIIYFIAYGIIGMSLYFYEGIPWVSNICISIGAGLMTGLVIYILTNLKNMSNIRTELCVVQSRKAIKAFESIHPLLIKYNQIHEVEANKLRNDEHLDYFIPILSHFTDFLESCIDALPGYKNCDSLYQEEFTTYVNALPKHMETLYEYKEVCFVSQHMSYDQYHRFMNHLVEVQNLYVFLKEHLVEKEIELLSIRMTPL